MSRAAAERTAQVAIALGGNLGQPAVVFERALLMLAALDVCVLRRSALYRSRAWGFEAQPDFTNAAVLAETALHAQPLLERLMRIEAALGRRRLIHWGPRVIDLDLLVYEGLRCERPGLTLPHPGIARRDFVLAPLIDLGVPAPGEYGAAGWQGALERLAASERTIIERTPWS